MTRICVSLRSFVHWLLNCFCFYFRNIALGLHGFVVRLCLNFVLLHIVSLFWASTCSAAFSFLWVSLSHFFLGGCFFLIIPSWNHRMCVDNIARFIKYDWRQPSLQRSVLSTGLCGDVNVGYMGICIRRGNMFFLHFACVP